LLAGIAPNLNRKDAKDAKSKAKNLGALCALAVKKLGFRLTTLNGETAQYPLSDRTLCNWVRRRNRTNGSHQVVAVDCAMCDQKGLLMEYYET
jgi:hypothetical protein